MASENEGELGSEIPDRVAAIVDLMSHLFMLAVMLFVLSIPFRSSTDAAENESFELELSAYQDGRQFIVGLADLSTPTGFDVEFAPFLGDQGSFKSFANVLAGVTSRRLEHGVLLSGLVKDTQPQSILILLTNIKPPQNG